MCCRSLLANVFILLLMAGCGRRSNVEVDISKVPPGSWLVGKRLALDADCVLVKSPEKREPYEIRDANLFDESSGGPFISLHKGDRIVVDSLILVNDEGNTIRRGPVVAAIVSVAETKGAVVRGKIEMRFLAAPKFDVD